MTVIISVLIGSYHEQRQSKIFAARPVACPEKRHTGEISKHMIFVYCFAQVHQHNNDPFDGRDVSMS